MKTNKIIILSSAFLILCGCGNTSTVDQIAASSNSSIQNTTIIIQETTKSSITSLPASEINKMQSSELEEPLNLNGEHDIDLTQLSASVVYGQVYDMVYHPEDYIGKTIKIKGPFAYYKDEATQKEFFAVLITDAMACCSQGIEFVLQGDYSYPEDYPELDTEITVIGIFNSYQDNNIPYIQLTDATIIE